MWGVASGGSHTAMQSASYSGPGTLDLKYVWNNAQYSVFTFDENKVAPSVVEYFANEDYPEFFEFSKMGTYRFTYTVEAKHRSGTDDDDTDDVTHSDTETYTFHVGPIAELGVSDGGASPELSSNQVALTVNAVNNGPDHALGAEVAIDLTLPRGVRVADTIASEGTYDATNGKWDLGELQRRDRRLGANLPEAATLTIILEGDNAADATATATIANDNANRPYRVCIGIADGSNFDESHCGVDSSWHEGPVYDHRDDNNAATLTARAGTGRGAPALPSAKEDTTPAIVVEWLPVADLYGSDILQYEVWRSVQRMGASGWRCVL